MSLIQIIKKIFQKEKKKTHNQRDFVEFFRSEDKDEMLAVKTKLEKYKIPVYEVDYSKKSTSSNDKFVLRIPSKYSDEAKNIMQNAD